MKICPDCRGFELYNDSEHRCPHCGARLVVWTSNMSPRGRNTEERRRHEDRFTTGNKNCESAGDPLFERRIGKKYWFRGSVVNITPISRFYPPAIKWARSFFTGVPYPFGNPVCETTVRIEELCRSRIPEKAKNITIFGANEGLNTGDDISVNAILRHGRFVATEIRINDIEANVRQTHQLSGRCVRFLTLLLLALMVMLIRRVAYAFESGEILHFIGLLAGGLVAFILRLLIVLAPIICMLLIYWLILWKK